MGFNVRSGIRLKSLPPLFIIIALFTAAKLFFLSRYHLPIWDEAVYLGMGKYIYSLGGAGLWEILRPPGLPFITGLVWKLQFQQILFSGLITVAFGVGSIALSYLIAKRLFSKKVAVLASAFLAASSWFYLYSSYILTEIPSTFFALASIYSFTNKRYYASGALAALAMLFKFPHGLLIGVIAAALALSHIIRRRQQLQQLQQLLPLVLSLAKIMASFVAVTLPFLIFNYLFYRPFTSNPFDAIFRPFILGAWHQSNPAKVIADPLYNYSFYLVEAFKQHFAFVFALAAVFLFFRRKWFSDSSKLLLGIFLAVYLSYFTYISNKDERFMLLFLPAVCIFSAAAFFDFFSYFRQQQQRMPMKRVGTLFVVAAIALLTLSFLVALYRDGSFYTWRPASEPVVASELYKSVSNLGIKGHVLTSEPVFAAYNNNRFFPYYFTSFQGIPQELKALNEWEQNKPFEAVIYSPQTLFCPAGDFECETAKSNMYDYLRSNFKEVFNGTYYGGMMSYYVFVNESLYGEG